MTEEGTQPDAPAGKGRPTPKRSDARKRRRTATPTNRKEAAKMRRERMADQRRLQREALRTGDTRNLPPRDAGPEKALARDYVDSRFTLGQAFFGLIFLVLVLSFIRNAVAAVIANLTILLVFGGVLFDSARVGRGARRAVEEKYGATSTAGVTPYAMMRAMQPRRMRRPPPRLKRGDAT